MANLETQYLGLTLKNPIVVSSSGLTNSLDKIKEIEKAGAGALVLKSIFEEQINHETADVQSESKQYAEAYDYLQNYVKANNVDKHLHLIKEAKKEVSIPIIASINCVSSGNWTDFAKQFETAGADALELNVFILPTSKHLNAAEQEEKYYKIVEEVIKTVTIPVSVKISYHFTNPIQVVDRLYALGAKGVVMFNRFYEPDIDIDKLEMTAGSVFSCAADLRHTLRWAAIVADEVKEVNISASTGVHDEKAAIKAILAGASTVQVCSVLYQKGIGEITKIVDGLEKWMNQRGFDSIKTIKGLMSMKSVSNPDAYYRSQFMKYFSNFE
jgi:dihydroorotate dehydrogenase (fumarate)